MAREARRPPATADQTLHTLATACAGCDRPTTVDYYNQRTLTTLTGVVRFRLQIRRCHHFGCPPYRRPFRPEAEGRLALPHHEFGLDVLALVGALRYAQHRSVPEIHQELRGRGVALAQRTVTNLLDRYDELRALRAADIGRLAATLRKQGRVILAIDGLQPDVGHEVLWVLRGCLSGEVLLARGPLPGAAADLAGLLGEVKTRPDEMAVPVAGVVSDGQHSIRNAVAEALPGVPHQLCQFHFLREAASPVYEMDRHAKKELKKRVRGIRKIERKVEGKSDALALVIRGYCAAVRGALTDDGRPPLDSAGLKLRQRPGAVPASLGRLSETGGLPRELQRLRDTLHKGLTQTGPLWPAVAEGFRWVYRLARLLANKRRRRGKGLKRQVDEVVAGMATQAGQGHQQGQPEVAPSLRHFAKVYAGYQTGLFRCYDIQDLPRTNNDPEQLFGSHRHHERRASGRKGASPGLVVRGSVRLVAAVATRLGVVSGEELAPRRIEDWHKQRAELQNRCLARVYQRRFRRDPLAYLYNLELVYRQLSLPA